MTAFPPDASPIDVAVIGGGPAGLMAAERLQAHGLPVLIHTPHRDKVTGTKRSLALVREVGVPEEMVVIDHLNELTLPLVLDSGCWRGHSIYPHTKMTEERMVVLHGG